MDLAEIEQQARQATKEIVEASKIKRGQIFVVGCSSSEVLGEKIGTNTSVDVAVALYKGISSVLDEKGIYMAAQCCEHLNRALVIKREAMEKYDFEQVNAIPQPKAEAGIDIGGTLIGMHIHPVVVPLRISLSKIGAANIICARRRPKYVGGQRAIYDESLM